MDRALTIDDFGEFAAEVRRFFADGFGFDWAHGEVEAERGQDDRVRMWEIIRQSMSGPPSHHSDEQALLAEIYSLHGELSDYLSPVDRAWGARVGTIEPLVAEVGRLLADLRNARGNHALGARTADFDAGVAEVILEWRDVEHGLSDVHSGALTVDRIGAAALRDDLAELGCEIDALIGELDSLDELVADAVRQIAASGKPPDVSALRTASKRVREAIAIVRREVQDAVERGPSSQKSVGEGPLDRYFARVVRVLPVVQTRYYDANAPRGGREPTSYEYEVPDYFLTVPRTPEARRQTLVAALATFRADFAEHLPATCRRDHRPPPRTGGAGNRNWVICALTAAMILAEALVAQPGDERLPGEALFDKVATRTREMLVRAGRAGQLAVDPSGQRTFPPAKDRHGPRRPYLRPRTIEVYPTTVQHIVQRRITEEEV